MTTRAPRRELFGAELLEYIRENPGRYLAQRYQEADDAMDRDLAYRVERIKEGHARQEQETDAEHHAHA